MAVLGPLLGFFLSMGVMGVYVAVLCMIPWTQRLRRYPEIRRWAVYLLFSPWIMVAVLAVLAVGLSVLRFS
jgi:hypothetical protein